MVPPRPPVECRGLLTQSCCCAALVATGRAHRRETLRDGIMAFLPPKAVALWSLPPSRLLDRFGASLMLRHSLMATVRLAFACNPKISGG